MRRSAILFVASFCHVAPSAAQAPNAPMPAYALSAGAEATLIPASRFTMVSDAARLTPEQARSFRLSQLSQERVRDANERVAGRVATMFADAGLPYPTDVMFRVFKAERVFEVWGLNPVTDTYVLVADYPVCRVSGLLGPKTRRGDQQVPEGFYTIDVFNPWSRFHLSMRVNYPNAADLARGRYDDRLGGDIFVHGGCATVGCVPVTDEVIEELYVMAMEARGAGQAEIPIHIFPARMEGAAMRALYDEAGGDWSLWRFWLDLKAGYDHFESHRTEPTITIDPDGFYRFEV